MKKKILLTIFTSLIFIIIGCKKENNYTLGKSDSKVVRVTPADKVTQEIQLLINELYGASKPVNNFLQLYV